MSIDISSIIVLDYHGTIDCHFSVDCDDCGNLIVEEDEVSFGVDMDESIHNLFNIAYDKAIEEVSSNTDVMMHPEDDDKVVCSSCYEDIVAEMEDEDETEEEQLVACFPPKVAEYF